MDVTIEEQEICNRAIASYAQDGHIFHVQYITSYSQVEHGPKCIYMVMGEVRGQACKVCLMHHPVSACILYMRVGDDFVQLVNEEVKGQTHDQASWIALIDEEQ